MAVPSAPTEGGGSKIIFLSHDAGGSNEALLIRGYHKATVNSTIHGEMGVYPTSGTLENGHKAMTAGAAVAISGTLPCQGVLVKADSDNAATIYVGKSDLTADKTESTGGWPLVPGESVGVPCRNASEVFIRGTGTDGVAWIASVDA